MCIIIYNRNPVYLALEFIASVCAGKFQESFLYDAAVYAEQVGKNDGSHGVMDVVFAGHHKGKSFIFAVFAVQVEGRVRQFVIMDIGTIIIVVGQRTVSNNPA